MESFSWSVRLNIARSMRETVVLPPLGGHSLLLWQHHPSLYTSDGTHVLKRLACFFFHQMRSSTAVRTIETRVAPARRTMGGWGSKARKTSGAKPPATEVGREPDGSAQLYPHLVGTPIHFSGSDEKRSTVSSGCQDRDCKRLVQSLDVWEGGGLSERVRIGCPRHHTDRAEDRNGWRRLKSGGNDDRK